MTIIMPNYLRTWIIFIGISGLDYIDWTESRLNHKRTIAMRCDARNEEMRHVNMPEWTGNSASFWSGVLLFSLLLAEAFFIICDVTHFINVKCQPSDNWVGGWQSISKYRWKSSNKKTCLQKHTDASFSHQKKTFQIEFNYPAITSHWKPWPLSGLRLGT